ncbi:MAG: coenzyme F420-0:L-glutamate ligase [Burkholderiaceae bacterium]|nr:coenzyme F420-0:L-glutamate ligase [Burkholderiaceae bacterium]
MNVRAAPALSLIGVAGLPLVQPGDDLVSLLVASLDRSGGSLRAGDVVVFAQKIVSKAEGRTVDLRRITPSARARELARETGKDARLVEIILGESVRVVRSRKDVLIVEHRLGFVMANAGVDQSNVGGDDDLALLLPADPDRSAERLRDALQARCGGTIAVIVNDSFGRPWRRGSVGVALGCSGLPALHDLRGRPDLFGRTLRITEVALADEIAAAASLLMGQADEAVPAVVVRGLALQGPPLPACSLLRPPSEDLFR